MHDIVTIVSALSGAGALLALGKSAYHTWRLEQLRHELLRRDTDRPQP